MGIPVSIGGPFGAPVTIIDLDKSRLKINAPTDTSKGQALLSQSVARAIAEDKRLVLGRGEWFPSAAFVPFTNRKRVQIEGEGDGDTVFYTDGLPRTASLIYVAGLLWEVGNPFTGVPAGGIPYLTADVPAGSWVLPLSSTEGLSAGDIIVLRDPTQIITNPESGAAVAGVGQQVEIKHIGTIASLGGAAVDTTTKVTLSGATEFNYKGDPLGTNATTVRRNVVAPGPMLSNFTIRRANPELIGADWISAPTVSAGGSGYTLGDTLLLSGGVVSDQPTVTPKVASVMVTGVSGGAVTAVTLVNRGIYKRVSPALPSPAAVTGGTGGTGDDSTIAKIAFTRVGVPGTAINLSCVRDTKIEGIRVDGATTGTSPVGPDHSIVRVSWGFSGSIDDMDVRTMASQNNDTAPYPIVLSDGTCGFSINNLRARRIRHPFTTTMTDSTGIEVAHCKVNGAIITENAFAGMDLHPGARDCQISNVQIHASDLRIGSSLPGAGCQDRGRRNTWESVKVSGCDVGWTTSYGNGSTLKDFEFNGCRVGIAINSASGTRVLGSGIIRNPREDAITIRKDGSPDLLNVRIRAEIEVEGDPTGYLVNVIGTTWHRSWDIARGERIHAPDATREFNGVPYWALGDPTKPSFAKFQNFSRGRNSSSALTALTNARLKVGLTETIPGGKLISEIGLAPASGSSSQTHFWQAIYDIEGNLLGVTASLGSTSPTAGSIYRQNLLTPFRTPYTGAYYIAVFNAATTPITIRGEPGQTSTNASLPLVCGTLTAALTDPSTAPATIPVATIGSWTVEGNRPYHTLA